MKYTTEKPPSVVVPINGKRMRLEPQRLGNLYAVGSYVCKWGEITQEDAKAFGLVDSEGTALDMWERVMRTFEKK